MKNEKGESFDVNTLQDISNIVGKHITQISNLLKDGNGECNIGNYVIKKILAAPQKQCEKLNNRKLNKNITYSIHNNESGENYEVTTQYDVSNIVGVASSYISANLKNGDGEFTYKNYTIRKNVSNPQKEKEKKDDEKYKVNNRHKRTIEGEAREMLNDKEFKRFIERLEAKKERLNNLLKIVSDNSKLPSEIEKKEKWNKHQRRCCTLTKDKKTFIPNSLLKEFPELLDLDAPKCF